MTSFLLVGRAVERAGANYLASIGGLVERADPLGRVLPRSRLLCAGLGLLAEDVHAALAPDRATSAGRSIGELAALLSILTKIDDEVIDARAFHAAVPRANLREATRRWLAVTRDALHRGETGSAEPRAALAAHLGRRIRALAVDDARREELLARIREGWETQVDAVSVLTDDPRRADRAEVLRVTRRISGDWVVIIAAVGALGAEARGLSAREIEALRDVGAYLQRADALADLDKDRREGLTSTWAACELATRGRAIQPLLPFEASWPVSERTRLRRELAALGPLALRLEWIHAMLLGRAAPQLDKGAQRSAGAAACSAR